MITGLRKGNADRGQVRDLEADGPLDDRLAGARHACARRGPFRGICRIGSPVRFESFGSPGAGTAPVGGNGSGAVCPRREAEDTMAMGHADRLRHQPDPRHHRRPCAEMTREVVSIEAHCSPSIGPPMASVKDRAGAGEPSPVLVPPAGRGRKPMDSRWVQGFGPTRRIGSVAEKTMDETAMGAVEDMGHGLMPVGLHARETCCFHPQTPAVELLVGAMKATEVTTIDFDTGGFGR